MTAYRNINELVKHLSEKDAKVFEAFLRVNENLIEVNKLLNSPKFKTIELDEIVFPSDMNLLKLSSSLSQGCRYTRSALQTIATGTDTHIDFNTVIYDTDKIHDPVRIDRFAINTAGRYTIGAQVRWDADTTGYRLLYIIKNGTTVLVADERSAVSTAGQPTIQSVTTTAKFIRGDYLEVTVKHSMFGNLDITVATEHSPIFWAQREG